MEAKLLLEEYFKNAVAKRSSDLFILPLENKYCIKIRLQNKVEKLAEIGLVEGMQLINLVKYEAKMNVAEHRRPQVGALKQKISGIEYYLRLSAVGNFEDLESLVIRIIYPLQETNYFFKEEFDELSKISKNRGLVITSGPTGSGKTSLMYELARKIGQDKIVMCLEDPIEIYEQKFLQTQVNLAADIDYPKLLKSALRHRPDVLIVGEIRDQITAQLAVQASLSGHLVLSTIHAKSTKGVVMRLLQLGISPVQLENCLTAITYQRLLPKSNNQMSCLFDIGMGKQINELIENPMQGFFSWENKLEQLQKRGEISDEIFRQFQVG